MISDESRVYYRASNVLTVSRVCVHTRRLARNGVDRASLAPDTLARAVDPDVLSLDLVIGLR